MSQEFGSHSSQSIGNQQIRSAKYIVLMLCVRRIGVRRRFAGHCRNKSYTSDKDGFSFVIAHSLVRRFKQTGISVDAHDKRDVIQQRQYKAINLHSHMDVSGSSRQLWMLHTSTFQTRR